jgi:GH24 family phage-related lysozyme (muramidase)
MTRQLTAQGQNQGKIWEGLPGTNGAPALKAYKDPAGTWTIGWGHTKNVKMGDVCDEAQAQLWFDEDLAPTCKTVENAVKAELNDNQFAALVWFAFNVGAGAFTSSTLLKKLNATPPDYDAVPAELAKWNKITLRPSGEVVVSKGLINRRALETTLWLLPPEAIKPLIMPETQPSLTQSDLRQVPTTGATPDAPATKVSQTPAGKGNLATLIGGGGAAVITAANHTQAVVASISSGLDGKITSSQFWMLATAFLTTATVVTALYVYYRQRKDLH